MNQKEYEKFCKRYNKFKSNNLPMPFYDEKRLTHEYIFFNKGDNSPQINSSLTDALSDITHTGFYYPFVAKQMHMYKENKKVVRKFVVEHGHGHFFETVVSVLYDCPESFYIPKKDKVFYSNQELEYLKKVQKYLLFIGMKDFDFKEKKSSRYRNKKQAKYGNAVIHKYSNEDIKRIKDGKLNFRVIEWYPEYSGDEEYVKNEYQELVVDRNDNFRLFIEYIKRETKLYKDIKAVYKNKMLNDNDNVIVLYFKVIEVF